MYAEITAAQNFLERVNATQRFIDSLGDEHSQSNEEGQRALDSIKSISETLRKDMDAIKNTMSVEEADAAIALFDSLKKLIMREKKLMTARQQFEVLAAGVVN